MFDLGWSELLLIGIVILVALGPKELPQAMRMLGGVLRKVRSLSSEMHRQMDDLIREAELQDLKEQAQKISPAALNSQARSLLDPDGSVERTIASMPPSPGIAAPVASSVASVSPPAAPVPLPPVTRSTAVSEAAASSGGDRGDTPAGS